MRNIITSIILIIFSIVIVHLSLYNRKLLMIVNLNYYTGEAKRYEDSLFLYYSKGDTIASSYYYKKCKNSIDSGFYYSKKFQKYYKIK